MSLGEPERTQGEINFILFGIPVRVHPFFWVIGLLLGLRGATAVTLLVWIAAMFVGILVHELGHALVMRLYGYSPSIVLYGMGGLAIPGFGRAYGRREPGTWGQVAISAAGPGAGFLLAAIVCGAVLLSGHRVEPVRGFPVIVQTADIVGSQAFTFFIDDLLVISILWGLINLLPIFPLDGGQIAQQIFIHVDPWNGLRKALILSVVTGVLAAAYSFLQFRDLWMTILFGYFAFNSLTILRSSGGRSW